MSSSGGRATEAAEVGVTGLENWNEQRAADRRRRRLNDAADGGKDRPSLPVQPSLMALDPSNRSAGRYTSKDRRDNVTHDMVVLKT